MLCRPFISYAKEDRAVAERLCSDLRALGADPWLDVHKLRGGESWRDVVVAALRCATHILILISKSSVSKTGFVQSEVRLALELLEMVPPGKVFVVPIRLDESIPQHDRLNELHWIDLYQNYFAALTQIAYSLNLPTSLTSHSMASTRAMHQGAGLLDSVLSVTHSQQSVEIKAPFILADPILTNTQLFRAILNPKLYQSLGRTLRLAFVTSGHNQDRKEYISASQAPLKANTVLGLYDLVLAHLGQSEKEFLREVQSLTGGDCTSAEAECPAFFEVDAVHKHKGFLATQPLTALPDRKTLQLLVEAAYGGTSLNSFQRDWLNAGYILGVEPFRLRKGILGAYILVAFTSQSADTYASQSNLEQILTKAVLFDQRASSVYQGRGRGALHDVQLLISMQSMPEELFEFINSLHYRCAMLKIPVHTNTSIIVGTALSKLAYGLL